MMAGQKTHEPGESGGNVGPGEGGGGSHGGDGGGSEGGGGDGARMRTLLRTGPEALRTATPTTWRRAASSLISACKAFVTLAEPLGPESVGPVVVIAATTLTLAAVTVMLMAAGAILMALAREALKLAWSKLSTMPTQLRKSSTTSIA